MTYSEVCGLPQLAFSTAEKRANDVFGGTCEEAGTPELRHRMDFGCLHLEKASGCGMYDTSGSQEVVVIRRYTACRNLLLVPLKKGRGGGLGGTCEEADTSELRLRACFGCLR